MSIAVSIIEDDPGVRTILSDWIRNAEGFRLVSNYSNVESAAAKLPTDRPDVALVDINLSGQSGIDFVRRHKISLPRRSL